MFSDKKKKTMSAEEVENYGEFIQTLTVPVSTSLGENGEQYLDKWELWRQLGMSKGT